MRVMTLNEAYASVTAPPEGLGERIDTSELSVLPNNGLT